MNLGFGAIAHFNMPTFTGGDAADADIDPDTFTPTDLDIDQWLDACVAAGMKYAALTTKHHDGFAMWPTTYAVSGEDPYSIAQTAWYVANGSPDVVGLFVAGCRSRSLAPVLYYSISDYTYEARSGTNQITDPAGYVAMIEAQLTELLSNYGAITAVLFDGWGWLKTYAAIDFGTIYDHVKSIQPNCLVIDNAHLHPTPGSQIETYESNETPVEAGNTRLSEAIEVIRLNNHWFYWPADSHGAGDYRTKANILADVAFCNANACTFMLDITPGTDGHLPAAQVALLQSLGA